MLHKNYFSHVAASFAIFVATVFIGCDSKYQLTSITSGEIGFGSGEEESAATTDAEAVKSTKPKKPLDAGYKFESPQQVKGGDEYVAAEAPGYACPTLADLDGDGKLDLIVGQFSEGNMQFFRNVSANKNELKFASGKWLKTGDDRAVVPGVW